MLAQSLEEPPSEEKTSAFPTASDYSSSVIALAAVDYNIRMAWVARNLPSGSELVFHGEASQTPNHVEGKRTTRKNYQLGAEEVRMIEEDRQITTPVLRACIAAEIAGTTLREIEDNVEAAILEKHIKNNGFLGLLHGLNKWDILLAWHTNTTPGGPNGYWLPPFAILAIIILLLQLNPHPTDHPRVFRLLELLLVMASKR